MDDVDVLVVDAGPVGLLLGTELMRDGIAVSVIDKMPSRGFFCKALGITPRTLEILEEVLLGAEPKVISIDRRLSASTIATRLKQACEAIGIRCKPSKVPLLLVALVHAAKGAGRLDSGRAAEFEYAGANYRVLCVPSPYMMFDRYLSPAEKAVMRMRLEGKSHAEIAARRQTSRRTVANQVATAFHRLGVSCRSDLIELLIVSGEVLVPAGPRQAQSSREPPPISQDCAQSDIELRGTPAHTDQPLRQLG